MLQDNEPPTFDEYKELKDFKTSAAINYDTPTSSDNVVHNQVISKCGEVVDANDKEYVEFRSTDHTNGNVSPLCPSMYFKWMVTTKIHYTYFNTKFF